MSYRLVIFDCDGTLVDTAKDVCICFNRALAHCGFSTRDVDAIAELLGRTLPEIVAALLPADTTQASVDAVCESYRFIYANSEPKHTKPYPGMNEIVETLCSQGIAVAVNSNKPETALKSLISRVFPGVAIYVVGYMPGVPAKPDPHGALIIAGSYGFSPNEVLYIGDTLVDVETASRAGMDCAIVSWGQSTSASQNDRRVIAVINDAKDIADLVFDNDCERACWEKCNSQ